MTMGLDALLSDSEGFASVKTDRGEARTFTAVSIAPRLTGPAAPTVTPCRSSP